MSPFLTSLLSTALALTAGVAADDAAFWDLIERGDDLDRHQQTLSALAAFQEADTSQPGRVDVMLRIAKQYTDLMIAAASAEESEKYGRLGLDYALRSVRLEPENAKANLTVAVCYGHLAGYVDNRTRVQYARLVKEFADTALALDPADDFAFHVLGRWNFEVANTRPVLRTLARLAYGGLPRASNEEATRCFREAIRLAPERIVHRSELARVHTAMGRLDLARIEWQAILALPARDRGEEETQRTARLALGRR